MSLEKVDLAHCDHLTAPHIYGPRLTEIGLAGCSRLGDAALEELCGGCPALRRLNIQRIARGRYSRERPKRAFRKMKAAKTRRKVTASGISHAVM